MDKLTEQIGVKLSSGEKAEILRIIEEHAPSLTGSELMRMAWNYFRREIERVGLLAILSDILNDERSRIP